MTVNYLVPWLDGSILWSDRYNVPAGVEYRPNDPFQRWLNVKELPVFRSKASHSWWVDKQGNQFPMLYVELLRAIQGGMFVSGGAVFGTWDVRKVGQNYSLRYLGL